MNKLKQLKRAMKNITPGPWDVSIFNHEYGGYQVRQAMLEQRDWAPTGWNISDEEGERRDRVVESRDVANREFIRLARDLMPAFVQLAQQVEFLLSEYDAPNNLSPEIVQKLRTAFRGVEKS